SLPSWLSPTTKKHHRQYPSPHSERMDGGRSVGAAIARLHFDCKRASALFGFTLGLQREVDVGQGCQPVPPDRAVAVAVGVPLASLVAGVALAACPVPGARP